MPSSARSWGAWDMQSELRPLGDFVTLASGNTPSKANPDYWGGSTPWVSAKDMADFWVEDAEDHLTPEGVAVASRLVPAGTVLLLARGMTLHKRVPICKLAKPSTFNQDVKAVLPKAGLSGRFLPYLLVGNHDRLHERVDSAGHGTGRLNTDALLSFPVHVPSRAEQEGIADIGEAIDDRLRLLRQANSTLESIAKALFKSWFIDFDPVRAKADGREPEGMDTATAALFPAEFEESALGLIPKGWRVSALAEHVSAERGLSYKGAGLCDAGEGVPMHNLNSVLEGGGYKYSGLKHYSGDFKDRHIVGGGEVIVANTEQGHEHRLIGYPAIVPMRYERAIFSHHVYRVRLKPDSPLTVQTLYFMLMAPSVREQVIGCANGSTVNMLKVAGLEIPQFVCPPRAVSQVFESVAQPLRQQAEANVERINVLTELRDTLLPRLISGRLRLPEVREQAEDALA